MINRDEAIQEGVGLFGCIIPAAALLAAFALHTREYLPKTCTIVQNNTSGTTDLTDVYRTNSETTLYKYVDPTAQIVRAARADELLIGTNNTCQYKGDAYQQIFDPHTNQLLLIDRDTLNKQPDKPFVQSITLP